MIRLQHIFAVEHADEVSRVMQIVQVSAASTFTPPKDQKQAKPTMHRVFNHMHGPHTSLQQVIDFEKSPAEHRISTHL